MSIKFNNQFSISSIFKLSHKYYKSSQVDDKKARGRLDITSSKVVSKKNFKYDRSLKQWIQTGQTSKIITEVKTNPTSYEFNSNIKIHKYPITFQFQQIEKGFDTPFRWREGDQKTVKFKTNEKQSSSSITDINITNKTQLQFFFEMEWVAKINSLLYGRCRAKWYPKSTNPKGYIYFGKHAFWVVEKLIFPLFKSGKLNNKTQNNLNYKKV
jgi:hypothetical protein